MMIQFQKSKVKRGSLKVTCKVWLKVDLQKTRVCYVRVLLLNLEELSRNRIVNPTTNGSMNTIITKTAKNRKEDRSNEFALEKNVLFKRKSKNNCPAKVRCACYRIDPAHFIVKLIGQHHRFVIHKDVLQSLPLSEATKLFIIQRIRKCFDNSHIRTFIQ